jgi:pentatricopeptide repeat protein
LKICFSVGKVEKAEAYFNCLKHKSVEIYTAMVNGYCEANLIEKSYELFCEISNQGDIVKESPGVKQLSKVMYSKVLVALCQAGNLECARSLFDFFLGRGFTPDVVTYTIMINSYCRMNSLQEAHDLLQDMKRRGIKPDVITYTVLLDGRLKHFSSQWAKGKDAMCKVSPILRDMSEMDISPDVFTYTVLIDGHIKDDNFQVATRLFEDMKKRGLQPDNVTYTALVSGLLNGGYMKKVVILYHEMSSKGMNPPLHIVSKLNRQILEARKGQCQK